MCIRDSHGTVRGHDCRGRRGEYRAFRARAVRGPQAAALSGCLLYTSDAADERSSVDLGGRRIIKKKKRRKKRAYQT